MLFRSRWITEVLQRCVNVVSPRVLQVGARGGLGPGRWKQRVAPRSDLVVLVRMAGSARHASRASHIEGEGERRLGAPCACGLRAAGIPLRLTPKLRAVE